MPASKVTGPGFQLGLGFTKFVPGGYALLKNGDGRFGYVQPGIREEVDRTGIAAGYRVVKQLKHNDVNILITTNGTGSKIYRQESSVWALKETVAAGICTDVATFHDGTDSILAWCFGAVVGALVAWRFSTDNGSNWTNSTLSGNAKYANYFLAQQSGLTTPRVLWVTDPNQLYFGDSLDNSANLVISTKVGDSGTDSYFTSMTDDTSGVVLIGKRHDLYSLDADGVPIHIQGPYEDPPNHAGGQGDRRNFENPVKLGDRVIFPIQGYNIAAFNHGSWDMQMAPREFVDVGIAGIPRLNLPVNALCSAGGWLIAALGSGNSASLSVVARPGGAQLLVNTFAVTSELYAGRFISTPEGEVFRWHGSLLTCTDLLRYMWFDEDDSYLSLASGASESADLQQTRGYFFTDDPLARTVSSVVTLNTGAVTVEVLGVTLGSPFDAETLERIVCKTTGLGDATPSLAVKYRGEPLYDTASAYRTAETFLTSGRAELGVALPRVSGKTFDLQFVLTGNASSNTYGVLHGFELSVGKFAARRAVGVL